MIVLFNQHGEPEAAAEEGAEPAKPVKDFKLMTELHQTTKNIVTGEQTTYEDILYFFLEKVFDLNEEVLTAKLGLFITDMSLSKTINQKSINGGISRFAQILCGLVADVPALPKLFANYVLLPLMQNKMLELKQIKWNKEMTKEDPEAEEEDYIEVEGHYKVMAHVMRKHLTGMSEGDKT